MRRLSAFIIFILLIAGPAGAAMVHYYDAKGQVHYINTNYMRVPPQYMDQVRPQLKALEPKVQPAQKGSQSTTPQPRRIFRPRMSIKVFVGPKCPECGKLERLLQAYGIHYARYDVQYSPYGQQMMKSINMPLPITDINGQYIQGANIYQIRKTMGVFNKK